MGAANSLFYSSNSEKQTLTRRVTPSDDQFDEQQERWNELAEHLIADLKERSGYSIRTWLQGSYKFGTQVRPTDLKGEFDIDLGIYFQWKGQPQDGKHGPKTLKSFVQDSLQAFAKSNSDKVKEIAKPKSRCCRIHYKNNFHIDVPTYHLDPDRDARCLATEEDVWENSDPKAVYLWFRDQFDDQTRGKVRRQIRYVKAWAALKFEEGKGRPSSILITVLTAEAAKSFETDLGADDDVLSMILESIVARLEKDTSVPNPVDTSENLVRLSEEEMNELIAQLKVFLDVAQRATSMDTELAAADIWQEAFVHLFPMPEVEAIVMKATPLLPVPYYQPEVKVTATSRSNKNVVYEGINGIGPIPKDCDILFEIINRHDFPANSTIFWVVRNEGREAENTNDLGHPAGNEIVVNEHSAYKGRHYMDCMIKVGDRTVAMRRIPVIISGQEALRGKPKLISENIKLQGRR